ncbi:hypothetical protein [Nodosilinea sp. E11]|uniref:hypothetical protein n=1 Tax=Nodosilinea sp. E11 TaxID=3037479 RepID=UPI00397784FD
MNEITRIQAALRPHLPWHGSQLRFLALFLVALFRVDQVNVDKLASVFANQAQFDLDYNRQVRKKLAEREELIFSSILH